MKEIKYQVFHKPTKTIQVVALIDFNNKVLDTYGIDEPIFGIPFEDVEWREYIGFSDKNNKDIYTRDILLTSEGFKQVVFSSDIGCYEAICEMGSRGVYGYTTDTIGVEVFGNIDLNPELLK
jgi:hypothetical protein